MYPSSGHFLRKTLHQHGAVAVSVGLPHSPVGVVCLLKGVLPNPDALLSNVVQAQPVVEAKGDQTEQRGLVQEEKSLSCDTMYRTHCICTESSAPAHPLW